MIRLHHQIINRQLIVRLHHSGVSSDICSLISDAIVHLCYWISAALDSMFQKKSSDFIRIHQRQSVVQKKSKDSDILYAFLVTLT